MTEWKVVCTNGHRSYERVFAVTEFRFGPCRECKAPRMGYALAPVR